MMDGHIYSLRFALDPALPLGDRAEKLLTFCKKAKIDDVMFFIGAESLNDGHLTKEMAKPYVKMIVGLRDRLQEIGVTTSLNPWATLLHTGRGRTLHAGQEDFRLMVDPYGQKSTATVCPLSEAWRKYYLDYLRYLCEEIRPEVLWLEDDFRMLNHDPLYLGGCFCEEHMGLYAGALGLESIDRDTFVQRMTDGEKGYREAYSDVNGKIMQELAAYLVEGLKDLPVRIGLMTSGGGQYQLEGRDQREMFQTLSRYRPSLNRVSLAHYRQTSPQKFCYQFNRYLLPNRATLDDDTPLFAEIENSPMSRYSKSARWTRYQMVMAQPYIMKGTTFDIFQFCGNGVIDGEIFAKELAESKPYLSAVNAMGLKYSQAGGVVVYNGGKAYLHRKGCKELAAVLAPENLLGGLLSCFGGALRFTDSADIKGEIVALTASAVTELSDDRIDNIFQNNFVVLNAQTVEELKNRGLEKYAGVAFVERMEELGASFSYEQSEGDFRYADYADERADALFFMGDCAKIDYGTAKIKVLSGFYNHREQRVANGITVVNGRVLVLPYYECEKKYDEGDGMPYGVLQPLRQKAISYALTEAQEESLFADGCMIVPYLFHQDGKDIVILNNYLDDRTEPVRLKTKTKYVSAKVMSAEDPKWRSAAFRAENNTYTFDFCIEPMSACVLELIR